MLVFGPGLGCVKHSEQVVYPASFPRNFASGEPLCTKLGTWWLSTRVFSSTALLKEVVTLGLLFHLSVWMEKLPGDKAIRDIKEKKACPVSFPLGWCQMFGCKEPGEFQDVLGLVHWPLDMHLPRNNLGWQMSDALLAQDGAEVWIVEHGFGLQVEPMFP